MDINIARTFLEVCRTQHFGQAADNLHVTTSAVSARIRSLEEELETQLFIRLHNEIALTDAAKRLIPQFRGLLQTWEQIRYSASVDSASAPNLNIAFTPGIWECVNPNWVKVLLREDKDLQLKIETASSTELFERLHQNKVDLAVTVEPHAGDDIHCVPIDDLQLSLYADRPGLTADSLDPKDYIHVDWGTSFLGQLADMRPNYLRARVSVSNVHLGTDLLVDMPAALYMPHELREKITSSVQTHPVKDAPVFRIPIYCTYLISNHKSALINQLIKALSESLAFGRDMLEPATGEGHTPRLRKTPRSTPRVCLPDLSS